MNPVMRQRTLSLAALFQAGLLADQIASQGMRDSRAMEPLLRSILQLDAETAEEIYQDRHRLEPGLRLLRDALTGKQRHENFRQVGHALALMQLARVAGKDRAVLSNLRHRLEALVAQQDHFPDLTSREFCHRAAGVYTQTLSTLKYRIRVNGDPRHLQNDDNAATIRALFLAGVRAAFLWQQNGGRRWQLMFSRRKILEEIDYLLV
jgi:high frequency lysogenization protein